MNKNNTSKNEWTQFWLQQWELKRINFHQHEFEPFLEKNFSALSKTTVFVPLCGKSKDLIFFVQKGHKVVGVELSQQACDAFFSENEIEYQKDKIEDFLVYRSLDITIYCGDFFKIRSEFLTGVSFIYDRAALIALPKELRFAYVEHLLNLKSKHSESILTILLISLEYSSEERLGPPFSVREDEVKALYGGCFEIRQIEAEVDLGIAKTHKGFKDSIAIERVYLLTLK